MPLSRKVTWSALAVAITISGCGEAGRPGSFGSGSMPSSVVEYPAEEVIPVAKSYFIQGNYGHAARHYERAVELMPTSGEAWLGLAAAYDRIGRFELADRAYRGAASVVGERAEYYNNVGYSYLLRGDARRAGQNFQRALELAPGSLTIRNNLELLRTAPGRV